MFDKYKRILKEFYVLEKHHLELKGKIQEIQERLVKIEDSLLIPEKVIGGMGGFWIGRGSKSRDVIIGNRQKINMLLDHFNLEIKKMPEQTKLVERGKE